MPSPSYSSRRFSKEKPTKADFDFWERAIRDITSPSLSTKTTLGPYLRPPHLHQEWLASSDCSRIFHCFDGGYDIFQRSEAIGSTRSGHPYFKISTSPGSPPATHYASVTHYDLSSIRLHSTAPIFTTPSHRPTFPEFLHSFSNPDLWSDLEITGDGSWLLDSIINGTLTGANDGSYMPQLSSTTCSGAFILNCTKSGSKMSGSFVDESSDATNYRGELLGSLRPLLLIRAAILTHIPPSTFNSTITLHCDNKGVVSHGNSTQVALKQEQEQADLIRLLKSYSRQLPYKFTGHT